MKHDHKFLWISFILLTALTLFFTMTDVSGSASVHRHRHRIRYHRVLHIAKRQLGKSYDYGATGPRGFDCSGLTKYVYHRGAHKWLPRTAQAQYADYHRVSRRHRRKGDLVFFGSSKHNISHVGIYIGHGRMIDAQNRGVIKERVHAPWWHVVGYSRPVHFHHHRR